MFSLSTGSCLSGDDTYGNEKPFDLVSSHYPGRSTDQHTSTPYMRKVIAENAHHQNVFIEEIHEQIEHITQTHQIDSNKTNHSNEQSSTSNAFTKEISLNNEIDKLSLANRSLSDQLQSVRNQLSDNLNRVRDFEERVKLIPKLQLELSVEKAENRDLHLKLKALESTIERTEQQQQAERRASEVVQSKIDSSSIITSVLKENIAPKPFNAQRICATSLESLNIRFPNSASPNESQQLHSNVTSPIKVPPCTHNVGCMTTKVLSRDVGVVTIPMHVPTRTMAINTDINALNLFDQKKPIVKHAYVQCDHDPKVQTKCIATLTDPELPPKPIEKHSIAVMAIPSVRTNSCMARPDVRSIGIGNIHQEPRTRSFGTDPIEIKSTIQTDSPISLKLLDLQVTAPPPPPALIPEPSVKSVEKPKEFRSMGVQFSPSVSNKFSQCKEKPEPPPEIPKQNESTDTTDLTLHIHRGVNTDACAPKRDRPTNTDRIITQEKSTNTTVEKKMTSSSATNTDLQEVQTKADETDIDKCHNCMTKIEIKQRTIIKNPKKIQEVSNIASSSTNTVETHSEEFSSSTQQTDSHSRIPRATALISPRTDRKFTRQNTYTIPSSSLPSPLLGSTPPSQCPAEVYLS